MNSGHFMKILDKLPTRLTAEGGSWNHHTMSCYNAHNQSMLWSILIIQLSQMPPMLWQGACRVLFIRKKRSFSPVWSLIFRCVMKVLDVWDYEAEFDNVIIVQIWPSKCILACDKFSGAILSINQDGLESSNRGLMICNRLYSLHAQLSNQTRNSSTVVSH